MLTFVNNAFCLAVNFCRDKSSKI